MEESSKKKLTIGKILLRILTVLLALLLLTGIIAYFNRRAVAAAIAGQALGLLSSTLDETLRENLDEMLAEEKGTQEEKEIPVYNALEGSTYPEKYDLRDVDGKCYVTSVKSQGQFGTCWTFAAIAPAEASILSELDQPVVPGPDGTWVDPLDLSELHLGWFSYSSVNKQLEGSNQEGEGMRSLGPDDQISNDPKVILNTGGMMPTAIATLKSGEGVVPEEMVPYQPAEAKELDMPYVLELADGLDLNDPDVVEELRQDPKFAAAEPYLMISAGGRICGWNDEGDWSVDDSLRYVYAFELEQTRALPSPQYGNPEGVNAMKAELMEGRAVSICYHADTSRPSELEEEPSERKEDYIRFDNPDGTWAHFTYKDIPSNHAVCVVGWDDTYPASNFVHTPPGDGAWIVKNSWGSKDGVFPQIGRRDGWGSDGSGYFYLSYYDCSYGSAETLDFEVKDIEKEASIIEEHDFMAASAIPLTMPIISLSYANVFVPEYHERVHHIGVDVSSAGATLTCEIYRLKDGFANPVDGELLDTVSVTSPYAGYQRIPLNTPQEFQIGEAYSVVVTERGEGGCTISLPLILNLEETLALREYYRSKGGDQEGVLGTGGVGIVNPGESYVRLGDVWLDMTEMLKDGFKNGEEQTGIKDGGIVVDNFPIRAFASYVRD